MLHLLLHAAGYDDLRDGDDMTFVCLTSPQWVAQLMAPPPRRNVCKRHELFARPNDPFTQQWRDKGKVLDCQSKRGTTNPDTTTIDHAPGRLWHAGVLPGLWKDSSRLHGYRPSTGGKGPNGNDLQPSGITSVMPTKESLALQRQQGMTQGGGGLGGLGASRLLTQGNSGDNEWAGSSGGTGNSMSYGGYPQSGGQTNSTYFANLNRSLRTLHDNEPGPAATPGTYAYFRSHGQPLSAQGWTQSRNSDGQMVFDFQSTPRRPFDQPRAYQPVPSQPRSLERNQPVARPENRPTSRQQGDRERKKSRTNPASENAQAGPSQPRR